MFVYDYILLNSGFVIPCSMNIDKYSMLFFGNPDIDLLVFLEIFPGNEGFNMVSHLMIFLHSAHAFHLYSFHRQWNPLSSLLGL
jgi:hypothetical protein